MGFIPNVYEEHEANPWIEKLAPIAVVVGVALVIFFQQFVRMERGATLVTPLPEVQAYEVAREPTVGRLVVRSKVLLKKCYFLKMVQKKDAIDAALEDFQVMEKSAVSRVDRFRTAIVAAELSGAKAGVERLEKLETEVEPNGDLAAEVFWLLKRYRQVAKLDEFDEATKSFEASSKAAKSAKKSAPTMPQILKDGKPKVEVMGEEMRAALVARHGFFGKLALVQGPDSDGGERNKLLGGYLEIGNFMSTLAWIQVLMAVFGLVILGCLFKKYAESENIGLADPIAPTTVYLETFAIMVVAFSMIAAVNVLFLGETSSVSIATKQVLIWTLPLCAIWPRLRGVSWTDAMSDLGLHKGSGVFREVAIGIGGACASIPIIGIVNFVIGFVQGLLEGDDTGSISSVRQPGMYDTPDGATWVLVWLGALSSIVWAPIFEETVFRGAFQRWLRVRLNWILAVLVSSAIFGLIHPYSLDGLIDVAFGGICFGLIREWRQCLIAPIVMHFMHNGFISLQEIGFLTKLG